MRWMRRRDALDNELVGYEDKVWVMEGKWEGRGGMDDGKVEGYDRGWKRK